MKTIQLFDFLIETFSPAIKRNTIEDYKIEEYGPEQKPILVMMTKKTYKMLEDSVQSDPMDGTIKKEFRRPIEFVISNDVRDYEFKIIE